MTDFCAVPENPFVLSELHGFRDPLRSTPKSSMAHGWHMERIILPPHLRGEMVACRYGYRAPL